MAGRRYGARPLLGAMMTKTYVAWGELWKFMSQVEYVVMGPCLYV